MSTSRFDASRHRFDEPTRDDLRSIAPDATAIVPLGSTEQHGPHLPVCVDTAVVSHLVDRAAQIAAEQVLVVVTPALPFGFANRHLPFGGTISIDLPVYLDVLTSIGRSLAVDGFRRNLFVNGHGGNDAPVRATGWSTNWDWTSWPAALPTGPAPPTPCARWIWMSAPCPDTPAGSRPPV